jgi:hypothetical protein
MVTVFHAAANAAFLFIGWLAVASIIQTIREAR